MAVGRVNYVTWFFRVLGWDGVLPVCVFFIPNVIELLFPNKRGALELTGVLTPAIMFVLRLIAGKRNLAANHCSATERSIQLCFFYFGILELGFIDGVLILSHLMPQGFVFSNDLIVWVILISAYLMSMTIAMYPGRVNSQDDRSWSEDAFDAQEM